MPRRPRERKIGSYPDYWCFTAMDADASCGAQTLTLDEWEALRLIDHEGLTQEQCADRMGVARTTVTATYESARRKVAALLVDGTRLVVSGGRYQLPEEEASMLPKKGERDMRVAVTYDGEGGIWQHFGRTEMFKVYEVEDGKVTSSQVIGTNGYGHGALAGYLRQLGVDTLICGGLGYGAQMAVAEAGITLYAGVQGSADTAVEALVAGTLAQNEAANCDHHGHGEDGCGHGEGGCCH